MALLRLIHAAEMPDPSALAAMLAGGGVSAAAPSNSAPKPPPEPREPRPSPTRVLARPAQGLEPRPVEQPPEPPPDNAPAQISPEWRVKPQPPLVLKAPSKAFRRPKCKSSEDHSNWDGPPCAPGSPDDQAARYDAKKDSSTSSFAGEGDRKLRMKSYRESPRTDDYPGIRCTIFHRC